MFAGHLIKKNHGYGGYFRKKNSYFRKNTLVYYEQDEFWGQI